MEILFGVLVCPVLGIIDSGEELLGFLPADPGFSLGLFSPGLRAGAIMLVAVSAVISPVVFRWLVPPIRRTEPEMEVDEW